MTRHKEIDLRRVRTVAHRSRKRKAAVDAFGKTFEEFPAAGFLKSWPGYLKASEFNEFLARVGKARKRGYPFQLLMGAHVIKVGLSPLIIDLMRSGIATGISLNSAGLIHDLEVAFFGQTSEDVSAGLSDGSFGMAAETGRLFAEVVTLAEEEKLGLGEAAGCYINMKEAKYRVYSLLGQAERIGLPATVHVVIGTDIVNQHPGYRAGAAAEASFRDFKILAEIMGAADRGGVAANIGSAVVLPEVFLKALTVARNIKRQKSNLTTANFDMIMHYRPTVNVVQRPVEKGGKGYSFVGHHEIMIPLLCWALKTMITDIKQQGGDG